MEPTVASTRNMVVLDVAGQRLRIGANAEPSHLERLAAMVNERAETIGRAARGSTATTLLALIALDLADEIVAGRKRLEDAQAEGRRLVTAAESRTREVEQLARTAIAEAISEIDRALLDDDALAAKESGASETG